MRLVPAMQLGHAGCQGRALRWGGPGGFWARLSEGCWGCQIKVCFAQEPNITWFSP